MKATTFVLVFCNTLLQVYSAFFSSKPTPLVTARIGENVTLPWEFTLDSDDELVFLKFEFIDGSAEKTSSRIAYRTKNITSVDELFERRVLVQSSGTLTLLNVSASDRGIYNCRIDLKNEVLSDEVELRVGIPPTIQPFPSSNVVLLGGDHINIPCVVSGDPAPLVYWYWRGASVAKVERFGVKNLEITNAEPSHSGKYWCSASNYMGDVNRTLRILIYQRPRVTSFVNTASLDGTIFQCEEIHFTCEAIGNKPPVRTLHIYHNGRLIVRGSKTGKYRITEVQKKHEGRYCCVPENDYGLGFNSCLHLKVSAAPENCKKTFPPETEGTTNVRTALYFTGLSILPSDATGLLRTHSSSQRERGCMVTVLFLSLYSISNWLL